MCTNNFTCFYLFIVFRYFHVPCPPKLYVPPNVMMETLTPEYKGDSEVDNNFFSIAEEVVDDDDEVTNDAVVIEDYSTAERQFKER